MVGFYLKTPGHSERRFCGLKKWPGRCALCLMTRLQASFMSVLSWVVRYAPLPPSCPSAIPRLTSRSAIDCVPWPPIPTTEEGHWGGGPSNAHSGSWMPWDVEASGPMRGMSPSDSMRASDGRSQDHHTRCPCEDFTALFGGDCARR